jgi:hypothetical protein
MPQLAVLLIAFAVLISAQPKDSPRCELGIVQTIESGSVSTYPLSQNAGG